MGTQLNNYCYVNQTTRNGSGKMTYSFVQSILNHYIELNESKQYNFLILNFQDKCANYWPSDRSARYQCFVVDPLAEYNMPQYLLREFKVTDARDGQSRTIRQFQFTDWPEQGVPKSGEGFIDFIGQVHKTKEQFGQEGPITVHCRQGKDELRIPISFELKKIRAFQLIKIYLFFISSAGVGRTGVFITLSCVLERMQYEGVVDVFQTVRTLRTQRPAMVQTEVCIKCHRSIG